MNTKNSKKALFLVLAFACSILLNSCAAFKSCDCPGLEGLNKKHTPIQNS